MRKVVLFLTLLLLIFPLKAQLFKVEIMPQIGFTNGSTILDSNLFSIKMNSGVNFGLRTDIMLTFIGLQLYYNVNSLETNALDKVLNVDLDFSDKFVNYGIGVVIESPGVLLHPFLSATYGKTKFTGSHRYAPDGKHYSLGAGIKAGIGKIGVWGEIRLLRVMDSLQDYRDFFRDTGSFTTFSASGGILVSL